jgi:Ca2+-binding EF-hand superfamily protein
LISLLLIFQEEAKRIFAYFDLDKSGTIDRGELQGLIFELGEVMSQEEVNLIFNAIDTGA